jgi:hypothetical protein
MRFFHRFTQGELRLARIKAFSDGIFAVAVTLLVLDLNVPELHDRADLRELALAFLGPLSYLIGAAAAWIYIPAAFIVYALTPSLYITPPERRDDGRAQPDESGRA